METENLETENQENQENHEEEEVTIPTAEEVLQQRLLALEERNTALTQQNIKLMEFLNTTNKPQKSEPEVKPVVEEEVEAPDFENLSVKDYHIYLTKKFVPSITKQIAEGIGGLRTEIEGLKGTTTRNRLEQELQVAMRKYSDLGNYRMQMIEISDKRPDLSVEEVYALAKFKSGGFNQSTQRITTKKVATEKPNPATQTAKPAGMNLNDAFEAAYDEIHKE